MLFVVHLHPALGVTAGAMCCVELTIASIENIDFRVGQLWITVSVDLTILFAKESSPASGQYMRGRMVIADDLHARCAMRGVFTMQDDKSLGRI